MDRKSSKFWRFALCFLVLFLVYKSLSSKVESIDLREADLTHLRQDVLGTADSKKVILFATQTCPGCMAAKAYMKTAKIDFFEIDLDSDNRFGKYYRDLSKKLGWGVPKLVVGDRAYVGFSPSIFSEELTQSKKNN